MNTKKVQEQKPNILDVCSPIFLGNSVHNFHSYANHGPLFGNYIVKFVRMCSLHRFHELQRLHFVTFFLALLWQRI